VECPITFESKSKADDPIQALSRAGCSDDDDVAISFGRDESSTAVSEFMKIGN
jgi:hypothetical protein